ncbi:histidine phosphatase family protein [Epibacterium sp. MM17-32]|uniref:histidine phosphatase family protein n=1 Tax=Epibacterium sp. MM17-32 TaxID=2917734 RepID=UPI001EF560B3|nr:histidine phosphatase family protein [Epibacterium sp. MM17-32]MCG7628763.1 histidine phosphatase family protein [Epibacterium sp. MM17-32]
MPEPRRVIALVRHGAYAQRPAAPSALQPFPLTEEGKAQAQACGSALDRILNAETLKLAPVIHASHQLRAWQTADLIAQTLRAAGHHVAQISETADLAERSVGAVANLTTSEIETLLDVDPRYASAPAGWKSDSHYRLPFQGAESLMEAGARVASHLTDVARAADAGTLTICVGHGASFRHAAHHLGLLQLSEIPQLSMFHAQPLLLCYMGHGRWAHFGGAWKQRQRQETHLD